jgi:diguanylate cyclase (GGDEF)-like protein
MKRRHSLLPSAWLILVASASIASLLLYPRIPTDHDLITLAILAILITATRFGTSALPDAGTARIGPKGIFIFAGAFLLAPIMFVLLALVPALVDWIGPLFTHQLRRADRRIMPLLVGVDIIGGLLVEATMMSLRPSGFLVWSIALVISVIIFLTLYRLLPFVARRALGEVADNSFEGSGRFDLTGDLLPLLLGASLAALWAVNGWLVLPGLLQILLVYRVAQIPQIEKQAQTDAKTGLWNARHLDILFRTEIERATRYDRPLSVMMADLDLMRNINNRFGHLTGDLVLRGIGEILKRSIREYDIAARFGGEEFVIVLPETGVEEALTIAERIRAEIEGEDFNSISGLPPIHATMSIGVASFPANARTAEELLHSADRAVYSAKAQGRNRVVLASHASMKPSEPPASIQPRSAPGLRALFQPLLGIDPHSSGREHKGSFSFAGTTLLIICALVSGSTGIIAAEQSLPGDALYPFKTMIENTQLAFTIDETDKVIFELELSRKRYEELSALAEMGRYDQVPAAALAFSDAIGRTAQSLAILRAHDPIPAESLAHRASLEWTAASSFLLTLRGRVPLATEESISFALAAVQSQTAMLETAIAQAVPAVPETQANSTMSEGPTQVAIAHATPVSTPPPDAPTPTPYPAPTSIPEPQPGEGQATNLGTPVPIAQIAFDQGAPASPLMRVDAKADNNLPSIAKSGGLERVEIQTNDVFPPHKGPSLPVAKPTQPGRIIAVPSRERITRCLTSSKCKDILLPTPKSGADTVRVSQALSPFLSSNVIR